ncbi:MAG: class I SAM-dependent methyltransferase [Acidobacteriota bacterium]
MPGTRPSTLVVNEARAEAELVLRELGRKHPEIADPSTVIAADDAMFAFALRSCRGVASAARLEYFASAAAGYRLAAGVLSALPVDAPVLDFGCGHGRVTRLLASAMGAGSRPNRLWATEADPDGVAFVRDVLGVAAFSSPLDPADFNPPAGVPQRFGLILAYSVLSHLPLHRWGAWMRRWLDLLQPGGLLVASVLPDDTLLPGRTMPDSGFHFEAMSESRALDLDDYGTAWVTESFVTDALREATGGRARSRRLRRRLWHLQDVYLVAIDDAGARALDALTDRADAQHLLDPGPAGRLERVELFPAHAPERLHLSGWASAGRGRHPATLEVTLGDGAPSRRVDAVAETSGPRPDAARLLGIDPGSPLGFELTLDAANHTMAVEPSTPMRIVARDPATGVGHPLWLGPIESASLACALQRTADERDAARDALAIVEASGFGRLRRQWMRWKQKMGFPR